MLINLSNHPSAFWTESQITAASVYGELIDLPFPNVDPSGDEVYIASLADEYVAKISNITGEQEVTVHLMGEMTLTVAILSRLKKLHINCIASTSQRIVTEDNSGKKEVQFKFERFRNYML